MENRDIAIVGMSIYCPAGETIGEFWHGIARGGDFITEAPDDVIDSYYFDGTPNGIDRFYCNRGGFCNAFKVDPLRYGMMPITASGTDPEHLISMAGAELALKDAGIFEKGIPVNRGSVIIGKGNYAGYVQLRNLEIIRMAPQFSSILKSALPNLTDEDIEKVKKAYRGYQGRYHADMAIGNMPNLVASHVAKCFNMHGPAYTVDAACASGVVAINHSISLLRGGECDIAIAGAMHSQHSAMFWSAFELLGAMSRRQVIAPFSKDADGLLIGQGGGFLVLKTLRKALEDGDRIYALIKETAVCSDNGASHVMVTSVEGQMRVLEQAWGRSGMDPGHIGYIEAHGTGTIVGDRVEITTLKNFFGDNARPRAYVGSVKSNIGHAMPAAGMIGIIKTALALHWRKIPPTLHCEQPLSVMFESRFLPPQELIDWDGEGLPLIAGVNSFGFGGINAHAIMTAYEPEPGKPRRRLKPYLGDALMVSAPGLPEMIEKIEKGDYTNTGGSYRLIVFNPDENRIRQAIDIVKNEEPCHGPDGIWFSNKPLLSNNGKIVFLLPDYNYEWDEHADSLSEMLDLPLIDDLISGLDKWSELPRAYFSKWLCMTGLEALGVKADIYAAQSTSEWDSVKEGFMDEWPCPPPADETFVNGSFKELIEKLYEERQARIFIQIGHGGLAGLAKGVLKGKGAGVIATGDDKHGGVEQLRRVMALLYVEGREPDPGFIGVKDMYRVEHSLLTLPKGAPPILKELPELNDVIKGRYGEGGLGSGAAVSPGLSSNPIAAATDENIREAISVQQELYKLFERRMSSSGARKAESVKAGDKSASRVGEKFEENLYMKIEDHLYMLDHSIVRQPKCWPHPEDWHTVVPLAMTVELFAEYATKWAPGEKLVKMSNVGANRWMEMEKPFEAAVKGEWISQNVLRIEIGEYANAECAFSDIWPEPPEAYKGDIDIGMEIMECRSSADLYESYSFHGPHYHSCIEMKRIAERGMLCLAQNQTGKGSLLDVMGQQIGHFLHLTQTENVISFPIRIQELTFFSDIFDQDGVFEHTLIVKRLSKNVAAADMVLKRGGSVWCVARDYIGQRFANFEPVWHVVMKPYYHTLAEEIGRGIYYFENTSRDSYILLLRKLYFNRPEREKYEGLGSNTARNEFLYSRIALKDAVRSFIAKRDGDSEMLYPIEIRCSHDENGRPYIQGSGRASTKAERIFVSLAHKGTAAAAIASEKPVGIDLEKIEEKTEDFLQIAFTDNEIRLIREINNPEAVIRFWAAKEAYAKKTGFGLKGDPKRYEVCAVEGDILYIGDTGVQTVKHGEEYIIGWTL